MSKNEDNDGGGWAEVTTSSSRRRKARSKKTNHPTSSTATADTDITTVPTTATATDTQSMIILVGIPGSGKSTFAQTLSTALPHKYVQVNQDTLKTRPRCLLAARRALDEGKTPIIDRCNFDAEQRKNFRALAAEGSGVPVDCVVFDCGTEECVRRCVGRVGHPTLHKGNARGIVKLMAKSLRVPSLGDWEGFRSVRAVGDVGEADRLAAEYLGADRDGVGT